MICPMMSKDGNKVNCVEKDCAVWCELFTGNPQDKKSEGKCALAWMPILQIETTMAIRPPMAQVPTEPPK